MERLKSMFKRQPSNLHYTRKASIVSTNESQSDSIYGITTPFQLLINDIRSGKNISVNMLNYVLTNFSESEKFQLIIEMNTMLGYYYNLVNKT